MNTKYILIGAVLLIAVGVYYFVSQSTPQLQTRQESNNTASPVKTNIKTYTNSTYGYTVEYPSDWKVLGTTSDDTVGFTPEGNTNAAIRIDVSNMLFDDRGVIPFTEYVKVAASNEIQNYKKLSSIQEVTTNSGIVGYETTWTVAAPPGADGGTSVSDPMTYFPLSEKYGKGLFSKRLLISAENNYTQYRSVYQSLILTLKVSN